MGRGAEWVFLCLYCYGMREAVVILLRGVGQVLFRRSALSGLLMLAGIAAGSWRIALLALCGNAAGNLTARLCRYPVQEIRDGLYGFNGTLVGIAVGIFFRWGWETALLLVAASALATLSVRLFARCRLQGFTAPFILAVWMLSGVVALWMPELRVAAEVALPEAAPRWFRAFSLGVGQTMLQGTTVVAGVLFLAGMAVDDLRSAAYAAWGALLPLAVAFVTTDYAAFNAGLYGYNGVLCAAALAGPAGRDFARATVAVLLSVGLQWLGMRWGILTLTAPFVLSVWMVTGVRKLATRKRCVLKS